MIVTKWYQDPYDGRVFWPDTYQGSNLDYGIRWNEWLTNENDIFISMSWDALPSGLSSTYSNDIVTQDGHDVSLIQISADSTGEYEISGTMTSEESGHQQNLVVKMYLKVT